MPDWLDNRKNAPRWMDKLDIAKISMNSAIDGKCLITNMDIMDPLCHDLYLKFIDELRKSGIPEMEELKILNVCYRSASAGEEFTAYDSKNNAVEARYSASVVEQRTKERLKAWADAFAMMAEFYLSPWANNDKEGPLKNIERWLYQRDMPGFETTPAMKVPTAKDLWYADNSKPYDFTARKGIRMGFYTYDRLFPDGQQTMAIKVTYYDGIAGTLKLIYENNNGIQSDSVLSLGNDVVRTATYFINARTSDTTLEHHFDFILESEEEVPVFFVRVIKTEESYFNTDQSPYGGINHVIPGKIEAEHYDEGDQGLAYHDDAMRQDDGNFRPDALVDVIAKPTASNGYVVSHTNEGEWLEYTVDTEAGAYDITLHYFCGEKPGALLLK